MTGRIPRRATRLAAALLASSVILAVAAGVAGASPTAGRAGLSAKAAGAPLTPKSKEAFTFNLTEPVFYGPVACHGVHVTNEKKGWPGIPGPGGTGGRDVEKCKSTTGLPLVGMTAGEHKVGPPIEGDPLWGSDWDANAITTSDFEYTVNKNGKAFKIIAIYPFP